VCLIALALGQHRRWPLVVAANRDEFLHRPSAALDWWRPSPAAEPLLGGRDLQAGGTWMGLAANGRLAMVTNVRDLARHRATAPSRGQVVPDWLVTSQTASAFWQETAARGHNPFNLLAADMAQRQWWWADDRASAPQALGPGLYGLSNAALNTPWPKVQRLKRAVAEAIATAASLAALEAALFAALADRCTVPDDALPETGVGVERERWLAPAFIRTPDGRYGTRGSTLLIAEQGDEGLGVHMVERVFDAGGLAVTQRRARLPRWPLPAGELAPVGDEPFRPD
jgi:uncharacterized protein with NRDE domain